MEVSKIFALLTEETISAFKKTSMFRHHFNSELVLMDCSESFMTIKFTDYKTIFCTYQVREYIGCIKYAFVDAGQGYDRYMSRFINRYIDCEKPYEYGHIDVRYYYDHPLDLIITTYDDSINRYSDYIYWLIQGNKPRQLSRWNNGNIDIPDHIIYLKMMCDCELYHGNIPIPKQILFLEMQCTIHIDTEQFIAYEYDLPGNSCAGEYVQEEFRKYTFRNLPKSARR